MCGRPLMRQAVRVTNLPMAVDQALVALQVIAWGWAGVWAAGLPYGRNATAVRRRVTGTLAVVAVAMLLTLSWSTLTARTGLSLPFLLVPALATVVFSVPRLIRLRGAAGVLPNVVAPSLRHEAAHPLVAWPVQATVLGAAASEIVLLFVAYPAIPFAVASVTGLAALAGWIRLRRRHARFAGDVVFPSRRGRLARSTSIVVTVAAFAVAGPLAALATASPAAINSTVDSATHDSTVP
jgi:hypothetical protein